MKKNLTSILATALLVAVLGAFFSCSKEKPKDKALQLAGTQWVGTVSEEDYPSPLPYNIIFFSETEGEATIPVLNGRWSGDKIDGTFTTFTTPFTYTVEDTCIRFKANMTEYSRTLDFVNAAKHYLHGLWLIKSRTNNELVCYRTPGSEVVLTLKKVQP